MTKQMILDRDVSSITVCVVGLGYVGYPLASAFAEKIRTIGYDVDATKIAFINDTPCNRIEAMTTTPSRRSRSLSPGWMRRLQRHLLLSMV